MYIFYTPDIDVSQELPAEEIQHCIRVLRLKEGDEISLTDGRGAFYKAEITGITGKKCFFLYKRLFLRGRSLLAIFI